MVQNRSVLGLSRRADLAVDERVDLLRLAGGRAGVHVAVLGLLHALVRAEPAELRLTVWTSLLHHAASIQPPYKSQRL